MTKTTMAGNPVVREKEVNGNFYRMAKDLAKEVDYFIYKNGTLMGSVVGTRKKADDHFDKIVEKGEKQNGNN